MDLCRGAPGERPVFDFLPYDFLLCYKPQSLNMSSTNTVVDGLKYESENQIQKTSGKEITKVVAIQRHIGA